jgi:hypothetical protein
MVDRTGSSWWSGEILGTTSAYLYDWPATYISTTTSVNGMSLNFFGGVTTFLSFATTIYQGQRAILRDGNTYRLSTSPTMRQFPYPSGYTILMAGYGQDLGLDLYFPMAVSEVSDDATFFVSAWPGGGTNGQVVIDRCSSFDPAAASAPWTACKDGSGFFTNLLSGTQIIIDSPLAYTSYFGKVLDLCLFTPWGKLLAVGAPASFYSGIKRGSVFLYRLRSNTNITNDYVELGPPVTYSTGTNDVHFGSSLAFSGNGDILVIGAPRDADNRGNVWVYNLVTSSFESVIPNPTAGLAGGLLGATVSVNFRGTVIVAGRPCRGCANEHTAGATVVLTRLSNYATTPSRRYIYMDAPSGIMLREIEVWSGGVNIGKFKPAMMSGTYYDTPYLYAQNGVDDIHTNTAVKYCSAANLVSQWYIVDIGTVTSIVTSIVVYNRADCCINQLVGGNIRMYDYQGNALLWSSTFASGALSYTFTPNV